MTTVLRTGLWVALAVAVVGCRANGLAPYATPTPSAPESPLELPSVFPSSLEPDYKSLPSLDPVTASAAQIAPLPAYRGLKEDVCRREAATRAALARLVEQENQVPPDNATCTPLANEMFREVRTALAAEARNRAAAQALESYFQLADAEGRGELVRSSLPVLDQLREIVRKAKIDGVAVPVDPDDLDRQRATLLGLLTQADLGAKVFDIELKRRIGYSGKGGERLRPVGPFTPPTPMVDLDVAIQAALENRADLRILRVVYLRLSPESLPAVRELIRVQPGASAILGGVRGPDTTSLGPIRTWMMRNELAWLDSALAAEVAVRRQQIYELIVERERQAADDVRAAAAAVNAQSKQVALTKWRAEQLNKKVADVKDRGPLILLPAELEAYRARADVIAAAMSWHQARVRLASAQGLLGGDGEK